MRLTTFALASLPMGVVTALTLSLTMGACSSEGGGASSGDPGTDSGTADSASGNDTGTNDTGTRDTGTDSPASGTVGTGPYALAYAGEIVGIDGRAVADGKATFDGYKMTAYEATGIADEHPTVGTNMVSNVAGSALYAIGRWSGGTTDGKFFNAGTGGKMTFAANGGFQYAIGVPADPIPSTGPATYAVAEKTVATVSDGSIAPGTVSGAVAVDFAGTGSKVGISITLDVPGDAVYTAATTGGTADPSQSEVTISAPGGPNAPKGAFYFNKTITSAGGACTGGASCSMNVNGFVGKNGDFVALVAHVFAGGGGSPKSVSGALVLKK